MVDNLSSLTVRVIRMLIDSYSTGIIDYATFILHIDKKISFIKENFSSLKDISVKIEVIYALRLFARTTERRTAIPM